jgi:hypothetical protein
MKDDARARGQCRARDQSSEADRDEEQATHRGIVAPTGGRINGDFGPIPRPAGPAARRPSRNRRCIGRLRSARRGP